MTRQDFDLLVKDDPESLWKLVGDFAAQVALLTEKLAPKPHTPPSAQGFRRTRSLRPDSDKKTGGQEGHEGHTLRKSDTPDSVEVHRPDQCPQCGLSLAQVPGEVVEVRQVVDLPEVIRLLTTEHQAVAVCCPGCQCRVKATFPKSVTAPVQYGPHLMATCVLLRSDQSVSLNRIVSFLTDWVGRSPSEGSIDNWHTRAFGKLSAVYEQIAAGIAASACAGFDETMVRAAKSNHWIHVARTQTLTHLNAAGGRGKEAMKAGGILPAFRGVAVHDALAGYFSFTDCGHSLCGAHLLREGKSLKERFDAEGRWSEPILDWLLALKKQSESGGLGARDALVCQLRSLVGKGYAALGLSPPDSPDSKKSACSKELVSRARWLDRLWFYASEVTRFGWEAGVPFDNNGSERDLRPVKRFSKVFGCWRSVEGLAQFCCIRSYLSTLQKQGISVRQAMVSVFAGEPIQPLIPTLQAA